MADRAWAPADVPDWEIADVSIYEELSDNSDEENDASLNRDMNAEDTTNLLHLAIQNTVSAAFRPYLGIDDHQSTPSQAAPRDSRGFRGPGDPRAPVPNPKGEELMVGSDFGSHPATTNKHAPKPISSRQLQLLSRELGMYSSRGQMRACHQRAVKSYIPESNADFIIEHDYHCYIGQFSLDGDFFISCAQDMRVRMYDTSDPYKWKYYKSVDYRGGQWTITDASLSPDNKWLAYSSITSAIHLADTSPERNQTLRLEFAIGGAPHSMNPRSGIMSVRFSGDGSELIVGAKDKCVYIYDIVAERPILKLRGHTNEVNAVCYGDTNSPHIIYSGSDDTTVKIWDRRSMAEGKPVGVFTGHTEGITFVHSKGDARYVLSNGKDQKMKLWDLRIMMSSGEFQAVPMHSSGFDYRSDRYSDYGHRLHPHDKSLVTYQGHSVHRTLIRCYFSPPISTGSRYVYSGSADGRVRIYNIDATLAGEVGVHEATSIVRQYREPSHTQRSYHSLYRWGNDQEPTCVRDVSWHPSAPVFAATSFQGDGIGKGTVSVHSWRGADVEKQEKGPGVIYTPPVYDTEMGLVQEA